MNNQTMLEATIARIRGERDRYKKMYYALAADTSEELSQPRCGICGGGPWESISDWMDHMCIPADHPAKGQHWVHANGDTYEVIEIANALTSRPEEYPVVVVYKDVMVGSVWSRPMSTWHTSMMRCRRQTPRGES